MVTGLFSSSKDLATMVGFFSQSFSCLAAVYVMPALYLSVMHDKNIISSIKHSITLTRKNLIYVGFFVVVANSIGPVCQALFFHTNSFLLGSNMHFLWNNAYGLVASSFGHALIVSALCGLEEKKEVS